METTKRIGAAVFLALIVLAPARSGQKQEEPKQLSNTRQASCILKITVDYAILPTNFETMEYLLRSSGVAGKAIREVLDVPAEKSLDKSQFLEVEGLSDIQEEVTPQPPMAAGPVAMPRPARPGLGSPDLMQPEGGISGLEVQPQHPEENNSVAEQPREPGSPRRGISRGMAPTTPTTTRPAVPYNPNRGYGITGGYRYSVYSPTPPRDEAVSRAAMLGMPAINTQTLVLRLLVELPGDCRPAAEEYMRTVVRNFSWTLDLAWEQHRNKLRDLLNLATEEADRAEKELREMQNELRAISGSRLLSRPQILNDIEIARQYIERLQMDQAESTPRWESISKQIAETEAKLDKQLANDSVTKELAQIAEINNKQLSQMETLFQQGKAASSELEQVREKLARARIELAQRQEQLSKSARNIIESLNRNLADYSLMKTQSVAKMTQYDRQIQEASQLLAVADQYEILSLKADVIKQNLQEAIRWRDQMERRNRMVLPPSVTVIGAE